MSLASSEREESKEGYLTKRGTLSGSWLRRFFVSKNGSLDCLESEGGRRLARIPLGGANVEFINGSFPYMNTFQLTCASGDSLLVHADTKDDMNSWVESLLRAAAAVSVYQGLLLMQVGFRKRWKQRFFVLGGRRLAWFESEANAKAPGGSVPIGLLSLSQTDSAGTHVRLTHKVPTGPQFTGYEEEMVKRSILIETGLLTSDDPAPLSISDSVILLVAESEVEGLEWNTALEHAVSGRGGYGNWSAMSDWQVSSTGVKFAAMSPDSSSPLADLAFDEDEIDVPSPRKSLSSSSFMASDALLNIENNFDLTSAASVKKGEPLDVSVNLESIESVNSISLPLEYENHTRSVIPLSPASSIPPSAVLISSVAGAVGEAIFEKTLSVKEGRSKWDSNISRTPSTSTTTKHDVYKEIEQQKVLQKGNSLYEGSGGGRRGERTWDDTVDDRTILSTSGFVLEQKSAAERAATEKDIKHTGKRTEEIKVQALEQERLKAMNAEILAKEKEVKRKHQEAEEAKIALEEALRARENAEAEAASRAAYEQAVIVEAANADRQRQAARDAEAFAKTEAIAKAAREAEAFAQAAREAEAIAQAAREAEAIAQAAREAEAIAQAAREAEAVEQAAREAEAIAQAAREAEAVAQAAREAEAIAQAAREAEAIAQAAREVEAVAQAAREAEAVAQAVREAEAIAQAAREAEAIAIAAREAEAVAQAAREAEAVAQAAREAEAVAQAAREAEAIAQAAREVEAVAQAAREAEAVAQAAREAEAVAQAAREAEAVAQAAREAEAIAHSAREMQHVALAGYSALDDTNSFNQSQVSSASNEDRTRMRTILFEYLLKRSSAQNDSSQSSFLSSTLVPEIEESLFRKASSRERYSDMSTLKSRLKVIFAERVKSQQDENGSFLQRPDISESSIASPLSSSSDFSLSTRTYPSTPASNTQDSISSEAPNSRSFMSPALDEHVRIKPPPADLSIEKPRWGNAPHPLKSVLPIRHYPSSGEFGGVLVKLVLESRAEQPPNLPTLNKWQHRGCAQCNCEITTGSFGVKANFCFYTELLYCPSCFGGEDGKGNLRAIPWRVVQKLDNSRYAVSKPAADYLDEVWDMPLVSLSIAAPRTLAGSLQLQKIAALRAVLTTLREKIVRCAASTETTLSKKPSEDINADESLPISAIALSSPAANKALIKVMSVLRKSLGPPLAFLGEEDELLPISLVCICASQRGAGAIIRKLESAQQQLLTLSQGEGLISEESKAVMKSHIGGRISVSSPKLHRGSRKSVNPSYDRAAHLDDDESDDNDDDDE